MKMANVFVLIIGEAMIPISMANWQILLMRALMIVKRR